MTQQTISTEYTYQQRLDALRATKLQHTREKQEIQGAMDYDDWAVILPPPERRTVVRAISPSGVEMNDVLLNGFDIVSNDPNGGFYGSKLCGENFRRLLEAHPVYIDPMSSLAGGYMTNFFGYRKGGWPTGLANPDFTREYEKYKGGAPIFGSQHFCQDLQIGLDKGWNGLLADVIHYRDINVPAESDPAIRQQKADFYAGLEAILLGVQDWIGRHAEAARQMARAETNPQLRHNLEMMAEINERLVTETPRTFHEAAQWIAWYQMLSRMYNGSGSLGRLDLFLQPYYERDTAAGILTDEEALFHIACLYLTETGYIQIGGADASGKDITSPVSYLALEAAHRLRIPVNLGVCVGKDVPRQLVRRAVEIICADKAGVPKFLGVDNTTEGFTRNGYPVELARTRAYSGCHWLGLPGREYTINDGAKINFAAVFEVAFKDMMADSTVEPSLDELWKRYEHHLHCSVDATALGFDFHMQHMVDVFPELVMDLLCHGPVEKGLDASQPDGVEYYNWCVDGAALATVADSFAALKQRVEVEKRITWQELNHFIETDWAGPDGERARLMMKNVEHFGHGDTLADEYAVRLSNLFTHVVKDKPTPLGYNMIPGLFSWAAQIKMGKDVGPTPNGRHCGDPISHSCNPDPGFRKDGAPTALAVAVARVQSGYGNTAPLQLDLDPMVSNDEEGVDMVMSLVQTHMEMGGTQINLNILDKEQVLEANKDPSKYPDLIVRVTGFSAYFASLSPEFRQIVVDRIVSEG